MNKDLNLENILNIVYFCIFSYSNITKKKKKKEKVYWIKIKNFWFS